MQPFRIGINMAGAISAGAYTAGVLDFLTEALDEWYAASARGEAVPAHQVSLDVFSGASAGGMCAAISSVMLQQRFDHIHDTHILDYQPGTAPTSNRFYEGWVNQIDITALLQTSDLRKGSAVVSLLDSSIIHTIAAYALTPSTDPPPYRPWLSPSLTLFLSLTNLRGTPYSLNGEAPGSVEETTFFYGDRIRFQTVRTPHVPVPCGTVRTLDLNTQGAAGGWDVLQTAAMATGAFPIFLSPRILSRYTSEYIPPHWESVASAATATPPPIPPSFPPSLPQPFATLNVDGGVTNNDPFNYAHDYLAGLNPPTNGVNPREPRLADRAVITVAPFPTTLQFDPAWQPEQNAGIFSVLPQLAGALIAQSRFLGESLNQIMDGTIFSRFVIAPADGDLVTEHKARLASAPATTPKQQPSALQCSTLGAFGGFFERGFRAHDYALGRRNCQKFLRDSFILPIDNVLLAPALAALDDATRQAVLRDYGHAPPTNYAGNPEAATSLAANTTWLPIIPLCSPIVRDPIHRPPRAHITADKLNHILSLILGRGRVVSSRLIDLIPFWLLRWFLRPGPYFIGCLARGPLRKALIKQLGDSYKPN